MGSYVEYAPPPELARVVRTVWIQTVGDTPYVQRHLPTGGVEIHVPIGDSPRMLGPLTGPRIDLIPAHTTVIGMRFWPGAAPSLPATLDDLLDQHVQLSDLLGTSADRLAESVAGAPSAQHALVMLERHVLGVVRESAPQDPVVAEAVQLLLPWQRVEISATARHLGLSASQLRRRFLSSVGVGPKTLQRTLRFQGFLALAQAGAAASGRRGADGMAGLAVDVGYADQAHLSRECVRITGVTPTALLDGDIERCVCGHDHTASFQPFLRTRASPSRRL